MVYQGTLPINPDYFSNLAISINNVSSCEELKNLAAEAFAAIDSVKAGIDIELNTLQPLLALLNPPSANPGAIVQYLNSFINLLVTPIIKPTLSYATQLEEISAQIASLSATISTVSLKFPNCSVSVPSP